MSEQRFDLSYAGQFAPGADPIEVRARLTAIFKLSDKGAERLFTGAPVIVKRDADSATVTRYEQVFRQAGAVLIVSPVAAPVAGMGAADNPPPAAAEPPPVPTAPIDTGGLALVTQTGPLEEPPVRTGPDPDISHLSLVAASGWTLEDCQPPPTPVAAPDLSYLSLEPLRPRASSDTDPQLD